MDVTEATTAELLNEVTASIREHRQCEAWTEVLKRIMAKKMTLDQFNAAQRAGFKDALPEMLEAYRAGYYFGHQGIDFLSFLMATKDEIAKDVERWNNLRAAAEAMGATDDAAYQDALDFARSRVEPSYDARRVYLSPDGRSTRYEMKGELRAAFDRRRDDFNAATEAHGWRHPFGGSGKGKP